ncbi:MAG: RsmD family RNA methyltransferase [Saprospiraceae bacterium]
MRVSGGILKGRTFYPTADNWPTRPTTDFSRTALFNILSNLIDFEETKMLDLFGGTGAHCYEMISRGCKNATYVDKFKPAVQFVQQKVIEWKIEDSLKIVHSDFLIYLNNCQETYTYIFAGPPYELNKLEEIPDRIFEHGILDIEGILVLEHNPKFDFQAYPYFWQMRSYGQTHFSFFKMEDKLKPNEDE